jgi:hypothetical protein
VPNGEGVLTMKSAGALNSSALYRLIGSYVSPNNEKPDSVARLVSRGVPKQIIGRE